MERYLSQQDSFYQVLGGTHERSTDPQEGSYSDQSVFIAYTQEDRLWALQLFFKEAIIWKRLRHPNIVPFIGVTTDPLQIVSEWMPNGVLTEFLERNPGTNRIRLVSHSLQSHLTDNVIPSSYWI